MVSPSSITLSQGGAGTIAIATSVTGVPQSLTLTVGNLPTGVTASFAPATIPSGGSSVLSLGIGATPVGTYQLTITASGSLGPIHTAILTLIVTASDFVI